MSSRVRWVVIILILILVLGLIMVFSRNILCQYLIERGTAKATGLELSIEDFNLDILHSNLYMHGITLFNPPGFQNNTLARAEEIFIKYELAAFLTGRVHLQLVKVKIDEINIIRNEKGSSNVSAFKRGQYRLKPATAIVATSVSQKQASRPKIKRLPKVLIDRLEFSLGKATFIDYQAAVGQPSVIIFRLKDPFVFKNLSNLNYVVDSVSAKGGFRGLLDNLTKIKNILPKTK